MLGRAISDDDVPWTVRIAAARVIVTVAGYNKAGRPSAVDARDDDEEGRNEPASVASEVEALTARVAALQAVLSRSAPIDVTPEPDSPLDDL